MEKYFKWQLSVFRVFGTTVEEDYEDSDQADATQQEDLDPLSGKLESYEMQLETQVYFGNNLFSTSSTLQYRFWILSRWPHLLKTYIPL